MVILKSSNEEVARGYDFKQLLVVFTEKVEALVRAVVFDDAPGYPFELFDPCRIVIDVRDVLQIAFVCGMKNSL